MSLKLITIFDKHEQFIKLQYESILKHVKGSYDYIVFNNASCQEQSTANQNMCDELGIKCIRINVNYNGGPSNIAGEALNESFKYLSGEKVFKIDSDMFFTADINLNDLFVDSDLIYIPNYKTNQEIMWSGVFGINLKNIDSIIDFRPQIIPNTDTFGQSCLLTSNIKYKKKLFELYNIQDVKDDVMVTSLNNDCVMNFKNGELVYNERPEFYHDSEKLSKLPIKYERIINKLKEHNFPEPYNVDIIEINNIDFIIHFKSSNWCPWYSEKYINEKTESLNNFLSNI